MSMESRHRRSVREVQIGWNISDQCDASGSITTKHQNESSSSADCGRIYSDLFDDADDGNADQNCLVGAAGGPAGTASCSSSTNCWASVKNVSLEEQQEEDDMEDEEEAASAVDDIAVTRSGTSMVADNARYAGGRRSLPATLKQPHVQQLRRWSPVVQRRGQHENGIGDDAWGEETAFLDNHHVMKHKREEQGRMASGSGGGGGFWQFFDSNFERIFAQSNQSSLIGAVHHQQFLLIVLLALVLAFAAFVVANFCFSLPFFAVQRPMSSAERLLVFRRELQQMLNQTHFDTSALSSPRTKFTVERTLNYLADKMARRQRSQIGSNNNKFGHHMPPLVLLLLSAPSAPDISSGCADSIAAQYAVLLMKHWPEYRLINGTAHADHTKSELSNLLVSPLFHPSSSTLQQGGGDADDVLMLLHGIDRLRGAAPLFLHSLTDPESSPIVEAGRHNVLIILTMSTTTAHSDNVGDCETQIASSLLASWRSDAVTDDQVRPIVARISAIPLCV